MLAFPWKEFYGQRELRFWRRGIMSWISSPGAAGLGWSPLLHDGCAIRSALVLGNEQKVRQEEMEAEGLSVQVHLADAWFTACSSVCVFACGDTMAWL